jgi:hypothetical protein
MHDWSSLAVAFDNLGGTLFHDCQSMEEISGKDRKFRQLYTNYAQLLNSMNAQIETIKIRFDEIDGEG